MQGTKSFSSLVRVPSVAAAYLAAAVGAAAQEEGSAESPLVVDATAPEVWDVGALTPAELDALERRRALLATDDPSWSRDLGGKWALGANQRLNEPLPASGEQDTAPVGLKLERRF